jgi:hypothetical protein
MIINPSTRKQTILPSMRPSGLSLVEKELVCLLHNNESTSADSKNRTLSHYVTQLQNLSSPHKKKNQHPSQARSFTEPAYFAHPLRYNIPFLR